MFEKKGECDIDDVCILGMPNYGFERSLDISPLSSHSKLYPLRYRHLTWSLCVISHTVIQIGHGRSRYGELFEFGKRTMIDFREGLPDYDSICTTELQSTCIPPVRGGIRSQRGDVRCVNFRDCWERKELSFYHGPCESICFFGGASHLVSQTWGTSSR